MNLGKNNRRKIKYGTKNYIFIHTAKYQNHAQNVYISLYFNSLHYTAFLQKLLQHQIFRMVFIWSLDVG